MVFITQKDTREKLTQAFIDSRLNYYESDDFKNNYAESLLEDRHAVVSNIKRVADICFDIKLNNQYAEQIYEHLLEIPYNDKYSSYYVGENCLDSVQFGEQEEEFEFDFLPVKNIIDREFVFNHGYYHRDLGGAGLGYRLTEEIIINALKNEEE
jgi:hypothetical protein